MHPEFLKWLDQNFYTFYITYVNQHYVFKLIDGPGDVFICTWNDIKQHYEDKKYKF